MSPADLGPSRGRAVYGLDHVAALIRDYDLDAAEGDQIVVGSGEGGENAAPVVFVEAMGRRCAVDADLALGFATRCRVTLLRLALVESPADISPEHPVSDLIAIFSLMIEAAREVGARDVGSFTTH